MSRIGSVLKFNHKVMVLFTWSPPHLDSGSVVAVHCQFDGQKLILVVGLDFAIVKGCFIIFTNSNCHDTIYTCPNLPNEPPS